jgi:MFS family permease
MNTEKHTHSSKDPEKTYFYGWVIVAALFMINLGVHATALFSFGLFVIPMSNDLGFSRSLIGWVVAVRLISGGLSSYLIGRLLDRYGPRMIIAITGLIAGLSILALSSISQIWQFFVLFAVLGLTGLTAPGNLLTSVPVAKWFVKKRGKAMAIATTGLAVGGLAIPPIHQLLIDSIGWRGTWVISGLITILVIVPISLVFLRRQPEDMGLHPDGITVQHETEDLKDDTKEVIWTVKEAFRTKALWLLILGFTLANLSMGGFLLHRVPYWVEKGFEDNLVAFSMSADAVAFGLFIMLGGMLLDRFPARYVVGSATLLQAFAIVLTILGQDTLGLFSSGILWGIGSGVSILVQIYIWAAYFGRAFLGSIRGLVLPIFLVAQGISVPMIGYIYDQTGSYNNAWWLVLGLLLTSAVIVTSVLPPKHKGPGV